MCACAAHSLTITNLYTLLALNVLRGLKRGFTGNSQAGGWSLPQSLPLPFASKRMCDCFSLPHFLLGPKGCVGGCPGSILW